MIDLKDLGIGQEELQGLVVKQLCDKVLVLKETDEDGNEYSAQSEFTVRIEKAIKKKIDEAVSEIAEKHVKPNIVGHIEKITLHKTNEWGEAKGEPVTFIEYLIERATAYMEEKVDHSGETKAGQGGYSWKGSQTRIAYLIDKHLQFHISTAVKKILTEANGQISEGLAETCKIKLKEISEKLKVQVDVGR